MSEGGVAAGVRRIEAVTGDNALAYLQSLESTVNQAAGTLKVTPAEISLRIGGVLDQVRSLEKELAALKGKLASAQGDELLTQAVDINGIKVLAATLDGADVTALRETMDKLKDKLKTAAIVLASVNDGKVSLIAGVTADTTSKVKAGELVNFVAQQVGGKGGGRADMAQAGGTDPSGLPQALQRVSAWVGERVWRLTLPVSSDYKYCPLCALALTSKFDGERQRILLARNAVWPEKMFALITDFMERRNTGAGHRAGAERRNQSGCVLAACPSIFLNFQSSQKTDTN